ncbi:MAG: hypothetical protein AAGB04_00380 [Pseudomonadota bacterium]
MEHRVAIERKSAEDCWGTVMGWETGKEKEKGSASRRERFEKELENLSKIEAGAIVVEASLGACVQQVPQWGKKTNAVNRKIFFRSVLAYQQDYGAQWIFCDTRRLAEQATFRWLERFYRHHKDETK